jgi:CheY-like chemotaxis protein
LLTFSKGGTPIKKILVISDLLKDVCQFTQRGSKITCEISAPEDLWPVEVDAGQIWQVINNLVVNADQAMPEGGTVRVTAENVVIGPQNAYNLPHAEYVKISVLDEGIGIAEQNISKIFDPYFTTKERGSGLGLATAYSIIKNHRGMITVESVLNKGTAFHIFLPASKRKTEAEEVPSGRVLTGKGKILVMDDEAQIRDVVGDLLTALGYGVCLAKDGVEAVDLYRAARDSSEPFDAVIMDLTVPGGVGGKEAVRKLLEIDPGVKAIVSSGYSNDPVMSDPAAYGFGGVVVKPYNAEELGKALYKILRQDSQRAASSA